MVFAAPTKQTTLIADREQAKAQLRLLGYQPGDSVYMRFFVPDTDPRYGTKEAARKADKLNWKQVEHYQNDGYGAYFVINGGGHTDKDVKKGRALFCEWDDRPIEDQIFAWQGLNLPEPSMQVGTRKSIHNYWRADLTKEQWTELQEDLLAYTQSDQTLKNPSRVLRLAGAWHIKPGCEPIRCDIIHQSEKIYTYEELRAAIPRRQQPELPTRSYQPSIADDVPLYQCLTKDDRALIDQGAAQGSRNDSGAKLARNLIGTAQRLNHLGIRFDGDHRQLFDDYCHRCNPPIASRESEAIWKSAQKDNPTASLTDDALENCAKAWLRNQDKASGRSFGSGNAAAIGSGGSGRRGNGGSGGSGGDGGGGDGGDGEGGFSRKVVKFPGFDPLTVDQVTGKIDELITQGASGSYLTGQLNRIAAASQFYIGELRKLYYERLSEVEVESDRDANCSEIEALLNLTDQSLDLADYLPQSLAQPINQWCNWLNIRPAVALTALLAGISSVHKTGTELVLQRNQNFRVPSTIYAALVSPSGQKKSPIFSNIIRQSLNKLEKEKLTAYEAAIADYEAASQQWENTGEGEKPQKPKDPPIYYFTNATGEAIPVQAGKDSSKTLLALIDELAGYFNSNNAYRNGRGSDKQDLLSYFDGSGQTILRTGGVRVNLKNIYLSIFGTIQPEILKRHMEDCSDPDGNWARFLFVHQPLQAATLHDDDGMVVQISDRLTDFYRTIDRLPEMEYRLSRDAFKRYQQVYNQLERLRVTHPQSGMAAVYSKMEGYIGRLALNLHVLWELDAGKACPDEEIPLFVMEMAIQLAKFYMGQVRLIHANADDESLPTHIIKLIELSKRLETNGKDGWIKAQQYRDQFQVKKRPSSQQARDWMNEAVTLGYGRTRGTGNRLEYHWRSDNKDNDTQPTDPGNLGKLGKVREDLGNTYTEVETIVNKGLESNLGKLGMGIPELSLSSDDGCNSNQGSYEEGGYVPEVSLSTPQEGYEIDTVDDTHLGNNLGMGIPKYPEVSLSVCQSEKTSVTVSAPTEAIASSPAASLATEADADALQVVLPSPAATPIENEQTANTLAEEAIAPSPPTTLPAATLKITQVPSSPSIELAQNTQQFQKGDRVMTPVGEGVVLYFNESWREYNVAFASSTDYFAEEQLQFIESKATPDAPTTPAATPAIEIEAVASIQVASKVNWPNCPGHWESWAPFVIEEIKGDRAKFEYASIWVQINQLELIE